MTKTTAIVLTDTICSIAAVYLQYIYTSYKKKPISPVAKK